MFGMFEECPAPRSSPHTATWSEAVDALSAACAPAATADERFPCSPWRRGGAAAGSDRRRRRGRLAAAGNVRRAGLSQRGHGVGGSDGLGSRRGPAPGERRRAGLPPHRAGWSRLPARLPATAEQFATGAASLRHVDVITRVLASPAARRFSPGGVVGRRGRAGGPRRPVHALGVAGVGHAAGRHVGPGRTRARRPAAGSGQRGAPAALPRPTRRHPEGAFRRRRDVRRDRRGGGCAGPPRRLRRPTHRRRSGRPKRWPTRAGTCSTTATCPPVAVGAPT